MSLGMVKKLTRAKVCVFTCPLDIAQTETKGTVLLKNAEEMLDFTRGEEQHLEMVIPVYFYLSNITHPESQDYQRNIRLRRKTHHRWHNRRRPRITLPQPIQHCCHQSPVEIRPPPRVSSGQRHSPRPSWCTNTRGSRLRGYLRDHRNWW